MAKITKKRLEEDHFENLAERPPHLRILFYLMNVHWCNDKECNDTAHYANGHGIDCTNYIKMNYSDVLKFLITRVIVGKHQDVVWEACLGAVARINCNVHYLFILLPER